jgi:hypothetical protein
MQEGFEDIDLDDVRAMRAMIEDVQRRFRFGSC